MIAPLLNRISRNKLSIVAFFGLLFFFYNFYIHQDEPEAESNPVKVGFINDAKQIGKTSPEAAGLNSFLVGTPTTKQSNSLAGGEDALAPTKPKKKPPPLPVLKTLPDVDKVDTPQFKPLRGGSFELLSPETFEKYKDYEIVYGEGGGTRLNNLGKKLEVLPPVSKLPRTPKFPVKDIKKLPNIKIHGKIIPKIQAANFHEETPQENETRLQRLKFVKDMFLVSWNQYKKYAWGKDEVKPVSLQAFDPFAGWAATLVDALDTLVIMGLKEEFIEAVDLVKSIDFSRTFRKDIPMFETTIRYLGGLLAAYDLSGERVLLEKAIQLGDNLIGAFDTPNHMPMIYFPWTDTAQQYKFRASQTSSVAELGSMLLEFTRLAQITGNNTYFDAVDRVTQALYELSSKTAIPYLFPPNLDASGCVFNQYPAEKKKDAVSPISPMEESSNKEAHESAFVQFQTNSAFLARSTNTVEGDLANKQAKIRSVGTASSPNQQANTQEIKSADLSSTLNKRAVDEDEKDNHIDSSSVVKPVLRTFGYGRSQMSMCTETDMALALQTIGAQKYTLGGSTDSTYEYYPKEHILLGGADPVYEDLYTNMISSVNKHLIFKPLAEGDPDILFVGNRLRTSNGDLLQEDNEVSHLSCFAGGMYALGSRVFGRPADLDVAAKLTDGCVWAYNSTRTGVMPESFHIRRCPVQLKSESQSPKCHFDFATVDEETTQHNRLRMEELKEEGLVTSKMQQQGVTLSTYSHGPSTNLVTNDGRWPVSNGHDMPRSYIRMDSRYLLRPEALESVFYMYRVSGNRTWQDKGWTMFQNIVSATAILPEHLTNADTPKSIKRNDDDDSGKILGFSAIRDVTNDTGSALNFLDEAESFWMAETLKYAYLLFTDPGKISLDDYVFNTEAHPLLFQRKD
jgi:mannosyl-oligosaccharide alpha-1,2-mannosidase